MTDLAHPGLEAPILLRLNVHSKKDRIEHSGLLHMVNSHDSFTACRTRRLIVLHCTLFQPPGSALSNNLCRVALKVVGDAIIMQLAITWQPDPQIVLTVWHDESGCPDQTS